MDARLKNGSKRTSSSMSDSSLRTWGEKCRKARLTTALINNQKKKKKKQKPMRNWKTRTNHETFSERKS